VCCVRVHQPMIPEDVVIPSPAVLGLSGWGYADLHAGVNFRFTEFSEVRLKTNSQKFWAPHRHTKDRGPCTTGPRPGKGRLALREAAPM
jgi:hypothetical protein